MAAKSKKKKKPVRSSAGKLTSRQRITADDLLRLHLVGDAQISPDGSRLLFAKKHIGDKNEYVTNLWMTDVAGAGPRQFTSGGKDNHGRWSPRGERIAFISHREEGQPQIYVLPASGGEAVVLTDFPEGSLNGFKWSPDGKSLAVSFRETEPDRTKQADKQREETGASEPPRVIDDIYYRLDGDGYFNRQRFALYLVDADTGAHRLLFDRDNMGWFHFDWSPDSKQLVVSANTHRNAWVKWWKVDLFRVDARSGRSRKIPSLPVGAKSAVAWSPNGRHIAFAGREGKEAWGVNNTHLYVCDSDGGHVRDLTGGEDYCLSAVTLSDTEDASFDTHIAWSRDSRRIFMNFGWQGGTHITSIAAKGGKVVFHTKGRRTVRMGNFSDDGSRSAVVVGNQTTLAEAAVARFAGSSATAALRVTPRTRFNAPLLKSRDVVAAEPHWVESPSGTKVALWMMKPPGFRENKKYPALLSIHGGPHCQYGETFFHEFQVMAAAGYVVVYSNPRGSKGYGEAHCNAIRGKWGQADWEDLRTVIDFMRDQSFIRSTHMGVCGGSYGGYMTNWVIGNTNEFAAAVTDRCVSNLVSMAGSSDLPLVPGEYWNANAWDNITDLWNQSPQKYLGRVATPTLIVHSEGDLRCNIEQSEQVFAALKIRGIPTRFVRYPRCTSHGMSRNGPPDLRLHRLRQYLDWWNAYLS